MKVIPIKKREWGKLYYVYRCGKCNSPIASWEIGNCCENCNDKTEWCDFYKEQE